FALVSVTVEQCLEAFGAHADVPLYCCFHLCVLLPDVHGLALVAPLRACGAVAAAAGRDRGGMQHLPCAPRPHVPGTGGLSAPPVRPVLSAPDVVSGG